MRGAAIETSRPSLKSDVFETRKVVSTGAVTAGSSTGTTAQLGWATWLYWAAETDRQADSQADRETGVDNLKERERENRDISFIPYSDPAGLWSYLMVN